MKLEWGYIWRTVLFHIVWVLLSPIAGIMSAIRTGGIQGAWIRTKLVYDSVYKKFVIRPRLNRELRDISEEDLDSLVWLSQQYPVSIQEAAEIWNANGRAFGATIKQIEALRPTKK
ncbi:hypothetical protein [Runella sp.]|uniref:hypothetical protein n=1 Tax=Runella sp. TaxID=1960881 RepID=UPI003D119359